LFFINCHCTCNTLKKPEVAAPVIETPVVEVPATAPVPEPEPVIKAEPIYETRSKSFDLKQMKDYVLVNTYFGTDRSEVIKDNKLSFGNTMGSKMSYGLCTVSIPKIHKIGEIETPSVWRFEFKEDSKKHFVIQSLAKLNKNYFHQILGERPDKKILLFIHGYNVSFNEAAKRTAQLTYDLDFHGIPMFYSWPSRGQTLLYTWDEDNIERSEPNIRKYITGILDNLPDKDLYIVGHSMGTRGLTRALQNIYNSNPKYSKRIKEVILAAPDIDALVFKNDIAPSLVGHKCPLTLYCSSADKALDFSKLVNGGFRAGDCGSTLNVVDGVETVNASELPTKFLGHSYFGDELKLIMDIKSIFKYKNSANSRKNLKPEFTEEGLIYWKLK